MCRWASDEVAQILGRIIFQRGNFWLKWLDSLPEQLWVKVTGFPSREETLGQSDWIPFQKVAGFPSREETLG